MLFLKNVNKNFSSLSKDFHWSRPDKIMINVHPQGTEDRGRRTEGGGQKADDGFKNKIYWDKTLCWNAWLGEIYCLGRLISTCILTIVCFERTNAKNNILYILAYLFAIYEQ